MVTPEQLSAKCPALAWAQHRFSTEVPLPSGRKLVHRFDIPRTEDERLAIKMTADKLIECYHDILGDITNRHEALDALADLLNARMAIQAKAVALQVKLVGQCLKSIAFGQWVIAHLMLRSLEDQLSPHEGELWAYAQR